MLVKEKQPNLRACWVIIYLFNQLKQGELDSIPENNDDEQYERFTLSTIKINKQTFQQKVIQPVSVWLALLRICSNAVNTVKNLKLWITHLNIPALYSTSNKA